MLMMLACGWFDREYTGGAKYEGTEKFDSNTVVVITGAVEQRQLN